MTYTTYDFAQQEVVQLAENEKDGGYHIVPRGPNLVEDAQHNVQHHAKVDQSGAREHIVSGLRVSEFTEKHIRSGPYARQHEEWYAVERLLRI